MCENVFFVLFGLRKAWFLTKNDGLEMVFTLAAGLELMEKKISMTIGRWRKAILGIIFF
jgi:hypothetical protein